MDYGVDPEIVVNVKNAYHRQSLPLWVLSDGFTMSESRPLFYPIATVHRTSPDFAFVQQAAHDLDSPRVHALNLRCRFRFCFRFRATLP